MTGSTPLVRCNHCAVPIVIRPLEITKDNGMKMTTPNLSPAFEHMKKFHPEIWTPELNQEYEEWKVGKIA